MTPNEAAIFEKLIEAIAILGTGTVHEIGTTGVNRVVELLHDADRLVKRALDEKSVF